MNMPMLTDANTPNKAMGPEKIQAAWLVGLLALGDFAGLIPNLGIAYEHAHVPRFLAELSWTFDETFLDDDEDKAARDD